MSLIKLHKQTSQSTKAICIVLYSAIQFPCSNTGAQGSLDDLGYCQFYISRFLDFFFFVQNCHWAPAQTTSIFSGIHRKKQQAKKIGISQWHFQNTISLSQPTFIVCPVYWINYNEMPFYLQQLHDINYSCYWGEKEKGEAKKSMLKSDNKKMALCCQIYWGMKGRVSFHSRETLGFESPIAAS